jgi:hypothetical protein
VRERVGTNQLDDRSVTSPTFDVISGTAVNARVGQLAMSIFANLGIYLVAKSRTLSYESC